VCSMGHVVHSGTSGARKIDTLFLCLGGTGVDSKKMYAGWDLRVM
jgi:hypothetical protein